jgi:putative transposase
MDEYESLSHTKWECKYHVVFIPKGRRRVLYGQLRQHFREVLRSRFETESVTDRDKSRRVTTG